MAETIQTIHVRGEGGSVIAMDLPLPSTIQKRLDAGLIQRVNADGSPYTGVQAPAVGPVSAGDDVPGTPGPVRADRPAVNAPKGDWIAYVAKSGLLSAEDAANYTKADLIDLTS